MFKLANRRRDEGHQRESSIEAGILLPIRVMRGLLLTAIVLLAGRAAARPRIVIVTATAGYRHSSIEIAEEVVSRAAAQQGVDVVLARNEEEMITALDPRALESVAAVFFVNTSGELPLLAHRSLLEWIRKGGTFVGFHSASDTWHSSPQYLEMLGGEFESHPDQTTAVVIVDDTTHRATSFMATPHSLFEEFYRMARFDPAQVRMLMSLRQSAENPSPAGFLPMAWEKHYGAGRVLYTALGHREDVWLSEWFGAYVSGAVSWAVDRPLSPKRRIAARPSPR